MFYFEYSLDLEVVTIALGRRLLSINNNAAATDGTSQRNVIALWPLREVLLLSPATMPSRVICR